MFAAIKSSYRNSSSIRITERAPDRKRAVLKNRFGDAGSFSRYSAMYFDNAVLKPETVMAKQIVDIGKIS